MPSLVRTTVGPLVVALIILAVTFVKVIKTYGDFWHEAFDAPGAVALLGVLNVVVGGIVIFVLVKAISPKNKLAYAVVVALSIFSFIATPIAASTFAGDEVPGQADSVKLSDLYNPLEKVISDEIDKPVKTRKRAEIAALVTRYERAGKAGKALLLDRLDESLAAEGVPGDEQKTIKADVTTILEDTSVDIRPRLRKIAQLLFNASRRDTVKDLAAK